MTAGGPGSGTADLTCAVEGDVVLITLDRPEARNALTWQMYAELERVVRSTTARCLVITGADPAFCSGDDVRQVMGGGDRQGQHLGLAGDGSHQDKAAGRG